MINHLLAAGPVLYGPRWQSEISRALGVTDRSIRRWLAGETAPDDIRPQLIRLIDAKIAELKRVRQRISR
jgi:predicted transcriptional regulator